MNPKIVVSAAIAFLLVAACGYKGDLYLPKKNDHATFGPLQTGIGLAPPAASEPAASEPAPEHLKK